MLIEEMPRQACIDFVQKVRLGRLACEQAGQPYVTPVYFAYHNDALYSFSTFGQKIAWMRANHRVCIEVDHVTSAQEWISVILLGRYEELPAGSAYEADRHLAHSLLQRRPVWWEPGYVNIIPGGGKERSIEPIYFRIHIGSITGHSAKP